MLEEGRRTIHRVMLWIEQCEDVRGRQTDYTPCDGEDRVVMLWIE